MTGAGLLSSLLTTHGPWSGGHPLAPIKAAACLHLDWVMGRPAARYWSQHFVIQTPTLV